MPHRCIDARIRLSPVRHTATAERHSQAAELSSTCCTRKTCSPRHTTPLSPSRREVFNTAYPAVNKRSCASCLPKSLLQTQAWLIQQTLSKKFHSAIRGHQDGRGYLILRRPRRSAYSDGDRDQESLPKTGDTVTSWSAFLSPTPTLLPPSN